MSVAEDVLKALILFLFSWAKFRCFPVSFRMISPLVLLELAIVQTIKRNSKPLRQLP